MVNIFTPIKKVAQSDPSGALVILSWAAAVVTGILGQKEYASAFVAAGAGFLGLRTQVVPAAKAKATVTSAATDTGTKVAADLTPDTVGAAGEVTSVGTQIVNDAVGLVTSLVGGKKK